MEPMKLSNLGRRPRSSAMLVRTSALVLATALMVSIATPAQAALKSVGCANGTIITGSASPSLVKTYGGTGCGQLGVRAYYTAYVGGPNYWTQWTYSTSGYVQQTRSNIVRGGHRFASPPAAIFETDAT